MGGTDDESNIEVLTIDEHANAHRLLFERYGKLEDRWAWKALSGRMDEAEEARVALVKQRLTGIPKTPAHRAELSRVHRINPPRGMLGKKHTPEWCKRHSEMMREYWLTHTCPAPTRGRRKFIDLATGTAKYFLVGQQPDGWMRSKRSRP